MYILYTYNISNKVKCGYACDSQWPDEKASAREPTCTGYGVTEVGHHSFTSSPPPPFPALQSIRYLLTAELTEKVYGKAVLERRTFNASDAR